MDEYSKYVIARQIPHKVYIYPFKRQRRQFNGGECIERYVSRNESSKEEIKEYDKANKYKTRFTYYINSRDNAWTSFLRSSDKEYLEWVKRYVNILYDYYLNFDIVDNLGGKSHISNEYNAKVHKMYPVGSFKEPSFSDRKDIFVVPLKGYGSSKYDKIYNPASYWDTFYAYFFKGSSVKCVDACRVERIALT